MHTTFRKYERLCSKKHIDNLFKYGQSFAIYPLKIYYNSAPYKSITGIQVIFAIPLRNFKKAYQRNLIRRRMREAFRKNKVILFSIKQPVDFTLNIGFHYFSKKIEDYSSIEQAMIKALHLIADHYNHLNSIEK